MTRQDLITAIAADLNASNDALPYDVISSIDHLTGRDAAILLIGTIEALGFVIVPRVPDAMMYYEAGGRLGEELKRNRAARPGDRFKAEWDGAIAGSPLYRDAVKG